MTADEFGVILEQRILQMRAVLGIKAGEHASTTDRLHNFKRSASMLPDGQSDQFSYTTPGEALLVMMCKHWTAIAEMVEANAIGRGFTDGYVDEKIGDAINYLVLLEALLKEK